MASEQPYRGFRIFESPTLQQNTIPDLPPLPQQSYGWWHSAIRKEAFPRTSRPPEISSTAFDPFAGYANCDSSGTAAGTSTGALGLHSRNQTRSQTDDSGYMGVASISSTTYTPFAQSPTSLEQTAPQPREYNPAASDSAFISVHVCPDMVRPCDELQAPTQESPGLSSDPRNAQSSCEVQRSGLRLDHINSISSQPYSPNCTNPSRELSKSSARTEDSGYASGLQNEVIEIPVSKDLPEQLAEFPRHGPFGTCRICGEPFVHWGGNDGLCCECRIDPCDLATLVTTPPSPSHTQDSTLSPMSLYAGGSKDGSGFNHKAQDSQVESSSTAGGPYFDRQIEGHAVALQLSDQQLVSQPMHRDSVRERFSDPWMKYDHSPHALDRSSAIYPTHQDSLPFSQAYINAVSGGSKMPSYPSGLVMRSHADPSRQMPHQRIDRLFKCEQCPQSFNMNLDLKRHKRIHLNVKPFACQFCSKSFSRKDALKVGIYHLPRFHCLC